MDFILNLLSTQRGSPDPSGWPGLSTRLIVLPSNLVNPHVAVDPVLVPLENSFLWFSLIAVFVGHEDPGNPSKKT
jgi:hypothetical protein